MADVDRLVDGEELRALLRLSRSTIHRMVTRGEFPAPLHIGRRRRAWMLSTVVEWIKERATAVSN